MPAQVLVDLAHLLGTLGQIHTRPACSPSHTLWGGEHQDGWCLVADACSRSRPCHSNRPCSMAAACTAALADCSGHCCRCYQGWAWSVDALEAAVTSAPLASPRSAAPPPLASPHSAAPQDSLCSNAWAAAGWRRPCPGNRPLLPWTRVVHQSRKGYSSSPLNKVALALGQVVVVVVGWEVGLGDSRAAQCQRS